MAFVDFWRMRAPATPQLPTTPAPVLSKDSGIPLANNPDYPLAGSDRGIATSLFGNYGLSSTGIAVTPWSAMTSSSVFACVRVLSEDLAKLPIKIMRRLDNGGWIVDEDHRLNTVFRNPNQWHNASDAIAFMASSHALRGNCYAMVMRDVAGVPIGMLPINPDRVSVLIATTTGRILYHISHQLIANDAGIVVSRDDMIHVKGVSLNGYMGISPIEANAETVGQSIALLQHGSNVFRNGATLGGFLKVAGKLSPEAAAQLSNSLSNSHAGVSNAGRIMVLENGSDFSPTVMTSEEAQYLEARGFSVTEIARLFRVPPSRIGELSEAHFNNLESQNQDFIDSTLLPNARRMEQEFERVMLFAGEQGKYRIRFDFDEMLRGDISTRYNSYSVGLNNGFLSRNEVRAMEGRPPVPGGETYLTPLNMGDASKPDDPMPSET